MSAILLETVEGLGDSSLNGNGGQIWSLLQGEKEIVCKQLADEGPLFQRTPINALESEPGEESERQIGWQYRAELENQLREIVDAQDRLLDGRFGRCVDCGVKIDPRRLLAAPAATLCVACQSAAEPEEMC